MMIIIIKTKAAPIWQYLVLFKYVTNIHGRIRGYLLTGIRVCIRIRRASRAGIRIRIRSADMRILTSDPSLIHTVY